ncbi:MAG: hypothetical protein ACE369_02040 [Roseovarius sp.]
MQGPDVAANSSELNVSRFILVAIPLGVVLIHFVMQLRTVGGAAHRDLVEDGHLMEDVRNWSFPGLYDGIQT